ncbi:hypothetical protein HNR60_001629 [Rhodopseudomonas rhenobacensis]|uniref:Uncharacterized protein n=1 Tax=Rhodopseudomonas rhenobacensis TaxID=87461 RepID=A0A7W8DYI5_9BRAD|nr:hypothetical protein [Rhodopseudomonas rhenobacensis]MBB5046880.1 hypothetical protein [Rhodopseudomonas rhenobacensis]
MIERALLTETLAAEALGRIDAATGALVPPLHPSTTYQRGADNCYPQGRVYSRLRRGQIPA